MTNPFALTRVDPRSGLVRPTSARERVDALLARDDSRDLIRTMDPQSLYALIHETGTDVAWDLLMVASGEQVQSFLDFDCWTRDEFQDERFTSWLEIILQREDDDLAEALDAMDPEVLVLWLRERVQVYVWEDDRELLDTLDGPVITSPCGVFALLMPDASEESEEIEVIRLLLDRLYAQGIPNGHRLLNAARLSLNSDLMERAFEYRSERLGDLGFVAFHEAQEVFAWRDPVAWVPKARERALDAAVKPITLSEGSHLDPVDVQLQELELRTYSETPSMFSRALGTLPEVVEPAQLERVIDSVLSQFRAVASRVHIADMGNPGDVDAMRRSVARADAMVGIALELAAIDDVQSAGRVLAITPLRELHQIGFSATARLQREAKRLLDRGNLTLVDSSAASLLTEPQRELLEGLRQRRPVMSVATGRRFERHADVEQAAQQLARVAFVELLFFGMLRFQRAELAGVVYDAERCASPAELVSFRSLFATMVLDAYMGRRRSVAPLSMSELRAALTKLGDETDPASVLTDVGIVIVRAATRGLENTDVLATEWATEVACWLVDEIGDPRTPPPMEIASQLVLLAPG